MTSEDTFSFSRGLNSTNDCPLDDDISWNLIGPEVEFTFLYANNTLKGQCPSLLSNCLSLLRPPSIIINNARISIPLESSATRVTRGQKLNKT